MTDRPILFSTPTIQALLAGRKTQTRRALNPQPDSRFIEAEIRHDGYTMRPALLFGGPTWKMLNRITRPGDRLWVRETVGRRTASFLGIEATNGVEEALYVADGEDVVERAGFNLCPWWRGPTCSSIHMPRAVSRITLTVTCVCVERLQHISEEDAVAEGLRPDTCAGQRMWDPGIQGGVFGDPRVAYRMLWDHLNGSGAWDANPWVAAISFTVERRNIDALASEVPA